MDVTFIDQSAALDAWVIPAAVERVAFDTEFVRESTYFARLGLVQVATGNAIALIDPLGEGSTNAIARFMDRCPTIVMHSASEDLEALRVACHRLPKALFDTQIAAGLAGFGAGLSLQKLIEATVGASLPKSETRTDWIRRPLTEAQLAYAADDVRHLVASADVLIERLRSLGRLGWLEEDCARMLRAAAAEEVNPHPHLAFKPAQRMSPLAQRLARRLLLWRDSEARRVDKPKGWVLHNTLVVRLAEELPSRREGFEQLLDSMPGSPRKGRDQLWDALTLPLEPDERDIPLAVNPDAGDRQQLRRMQQAVADVAAAHDLPEGTLAARRHLESLLATKAWPAGLEGWRRALLEPALAFALR